MKETLMPQGVENFVPQNLKTMHALIRFRMLKRLVEHVLRSLRIRATALLAISMLSVILLSCQVSQVDSSSTSLPNDLESQLHLYLSQIFDLPLGEDRSSCLYSMNQNSLFAQGNKRLAMGLITRGSGTGCIGTSTPVFIGIDCTENSLSKYSLVQTEAGLFRLGEEIGINKLGTFRDNMLVELPAESIAEDICHMPVQGQILTSNLPIIPPLSKKGYANLAVLKKLMSSMG